MIFSNHSQKTQNFKTDTPQVQNRHILSSYEKSQGIALNPHKQRRDTTVEDYRIHYCPHTIQKMHTTAEQTIKTKD